jgi:DNA-binding transcriptional regulator YhcF (GntR family)
VNELETAGYIQRHERSGRSNLYSLIAGPPKEVEEWQSKERKKRENQAQDNALPTKPVSYPLRNQFRTPYETSFVHDDTHERESFKDSNESKQPDSLSAKDEDDLFADFDEPEPPAEKPEGMTVQEWHRQRTAQALQTYHENQGGGWQGWVAEHPILDRLLKDEVDQRGIKKLGFYLADKLRLEPPWASAYQVKRHVHGLKELYAAVGLNYEAVRRAYQKMHSDGLTIVDANSLVKTATAMAREDSGDQYSDQQIQVMLEEVERHRERGARYAGMARHERILRARGLIE